MVAINMDLGQTVPSSGGGNNFPVSPPEGWLVQIVGETTKEMKAGQGNRLVFDCIGLDGPVAGMHGDYGLNLGHSKPETANIAMQELVAIGWAVGVLKHGATFLTDTSLLFNKPFRVVVTQQAPPNAQFTQISSVLTADGQKPVDIYSGKANGPTHLAGAPQIGGGQPQGQGGQPAGFGGQQQQPQGFGGQPAQGGQAGFGGQPQAGQWSGQQPQGQQQQPQQGGQQPQQQAGFGGAPQGGQQPGQWGGAPQQGQQPQGGQQQPQQGGQQPGQWGGQQAGGAPQWGQ